MDEVVAITAQTRDSAGRGVSRALRRAGWIPAVVYGGDGGNLLVSVELRQLVREIHRGGFGNRLYDVEIAGEKQRVLPREVQVHPVTDVPVHVDFLRLSGAARVNLMVPVVFVDEDASPGLKRGGVLNVVRYDIEFECRADAIPQSIVISLDGLDIGDSVHISDVTLPEGVRPTIADRNFTVATIAAPTVQVEEDVEEVAEEGIEGEAAEGEGEGESESETAEE